MNKQHSVLLGQWLLYHKMTKSIPKTPNSEFYTQKKRWSSNVFR